MTARGFSLTAHTTEITRPSSIMASKAQPSKPHVVAIPLPFFGHITPMMQLCKVLAGQGLTITFVNTERNHQKIIEAQARANVPMPQDMGLDIRMIGISDGLPANYSFRLDDAPRQAKAFEDLRWVFEPLVENLTPRPLCIISDAYLGWTQDVANRFAIPRFALWTSSAAECAIHLHLPTLISTGQLPLKNIKSLEAQACLLSGIPGLPPLRHCEFPLFLRVEDLADPMFQFFKRQSSRLIEAKRVILNSFLELEGSTVEALKTEIDIHTVGPLFLSPFLLGGTSPDPRYSSPLPAPKGEEEKCLAWLNKQAPSSVIYICFGSGVVNLPAAQIEELVLGLEASGQKFLLVFQIEFVDEVDITPSLQGFLDRSKGRGLVVPWAPQRQVLGHGAVGGFLTHCGWNSVVEGIGNGVPMLCWPVAVDQELNCKLVVDEWKVGLRVEEGGDGVRGREEVKKKVEALMDIANTISASPLHPLLTRIQALRNASLLASLPPGGLSHQNLVSLCSSILSHHSTPSPHITP